MLFALAVAVALSAASFAFMLHKDRSWLETPPYARAGGEAARALVVVYSRSGNTLGAAKEAARHLDAELVTIESSRYPRSYAGWRRAATDARAEVTTAPIEHAATDPSAHEVVVLASPTWLFRPAPPLWSFVDKHDLSGARVLLLMTGNSRYKAELIEPFEELVTSKGGTWEGLLFVERGRVLWQKSPEEVHAFVREALNARDL
jgi:flavodoxin